jgi:hypothetical protein
LAQAVLLALQIHLMAAMVETLFLAALHLLEVAVVEALHLEEL